MNADKILELLMYCLPAAITGAVAYNAFRQHIKNDEGKRRFELMRQNQKAALPLRLQAYERMALFMERIEPSKLLIRVAPISTDKVDYANYLAAQIEQEYEHNLSQQIYMSDECWGVITTAKNSTIQILRKTALLEKIKDADELRQTVLQDSFDNPAPSVTALSFIKREVKEFL